MNSSNVELEQLKAEFSEFVESSKEIEQELERSLYDLRLEKENEINELKSDWIRKEAEWMEKREIIERELAESKKRIVELEIENEQKEQLERRLKAELDDARKGVEGIKATSDGQYKSEGNIHSILERLAKLEDKLSECNKVINET